MSYEDEYMNPPRTLNDLYDVNIGIKRELKEIIELNDRILSLKREIYNINTDISDRINILTWFLFIIICQLTYSLLKA